MKILRYSIRKDWVFYAFILGYLYLILNMTIQLWFGEGVNIFTRYSSSINAEELFVDANKVYWSKTCFLFLMLFFFSFNIDFRFTVGIAATFWSISLILMFGPSLVLIVVSILGTILILQQIIRKQVFST